MIFVSSMLFVVVSELFVERVFFRLNEVSLRLRDKMYCKFL